MSTPDPEAPKLDPQPFQVYVDGVKDLGWRRVVRNPRFTNGFGQVINDRFAPRPEYSQNRKDYPNA